MNERLLVVPRTGAAGVVGLTSHETYIAPGSAAYPTQQQNCAAFSPDGSLLALGLAAAPYLVVLNTTTWERVTLPTLTRAVLSCAFNSAGTRLCFGYSGSSAGFGQLNTTTWALLPTLEFSTLTNVGSCAYSPDDTRLVVTCTANPWFRGWNLTAGTYIATPNLGLACVHCSFSPDGTKLAVCHPYAVYIFEPNTMAQIHVLTQTNPIYAKFTPDGSKLITVTQYTVAGSTGATVWAADTETWALQELASEASAIPVLATTAALTPDGDTVLVPLYDTAHPGVTRVYPTDVASGAAGAAFSIPGAAATTWGKCIVSPSDFPNAHVVGVVSDEAGLPTSRTVRAYDRLTGTLLTTTSSDASTGLYSLGPFLSARELQRVALDDAAGTVYNDLIDRVIPA